MKFREYLQVKNITEKNVKKEAEELIKDLKKKGHSDKQIKDYLEDGAALAKDGITDEDVVEYAHSLVK